MSSRSTSPSAALQRQAEVAEARRLFFEFYRAVPSAPAPAEAEALAGAEDLGVRFGGAPVLARGWGRGPLVVFVHGWCGRGGQFLAFVERLVARDFRAVVFDAPGHGEAPTSAVHIDHSVAVLQRIVEREGAPPHAMVAHSLGCTWALHAARLGMTLRRLVCISPAAIRDVLTETFLRLHGTTPAVAERLRRMLDGFEGGDIWDTYDPTTAAAALGVPGLVLHGEADGFIPPENGRALAAAWPGSELRLVEGRNHFDILQDPDVVEASVEFVARG